MDSQTVIEALRRTGERLSAQHPELGVVRIVLIGGVAGMLGGSLQSTRTTMDCDVIKRDPDNAWNAVQDAARDVARELGLSEAWLSSDAKMFSDVLPLDWERRKASVGQFGSLAVDRVSRLDLICLKVYGAPKRAQDRADLLAMRPTEDELDFALENLDRVEREAREPGELDTHREYVVRLKEKCNE